SFPTRRSSDLLRFPDLANRDFLKLATASIPQVHDGANADHRREHGREDADGVHHCKAAHWPCAEGQQGNTNDQRSEVGVKNGAPGAVEADKYGLLWWLDRTKLFPYAFVDQNVGVDGHTQGKGQGRDAR